MSVVDDAERIARAKCRENGEEFDDLIEEAKELLLKEALEHLASEKGSD